MAKFDIGSIVDEVKSSFKDEKISRKIGLGTNLPTLTEDDYIKMPEWWQKSTNTLGLPYGRLVMIAGGSDSGKTVCCIQAIKSALEQGAAVIYCDTELKTSAKDMETWGVDASQVMIVQTAVSEELYEYLFTLWDKFKDKYPDTPLLVIIDSLGNMISLRDSEIDLTEQSSQPGGKGKINRLGLSKIVSRMHSDSKISVLLVSYTYDQIGMGHGKVNAGGKSLDFYSSLTYQTTRKGWIEKTVKGERVRTGAEVIWKLYKNHLNKDFPGSKQIVLRITSGNIELVGQSNKEEEDEGTEV